MRGWHIIDHKKPTDHYFYCVTVRFDIRFFFDFHADACVLINDQNTFVRRLMGCVSERLPGWHIAFDMVNYVDPYIFVQRLPNEQDKIFFFKGFRYMYQHEYRMVALPPAPLTKPLEPMLIELGSLEDIAELVRLK